MQEIADGHGTGRAGTCISKGVPIIEPHAKLFSSLLSLRVLAETLPTNPPPSGYERGGEKLWGSANHVYERH